MVQNLILNKCQKQSLDMDEKQIIDWLLKGDVAIQYQVYRDLLGIKIKKKKNEPSN